MSPTGSWWWLAVKAPHSGTPFDLAHTIGCALLVIGACLLVSRLAPQVIAVVFGAGAMTLTLYSLHVVMRMPQIWPEDNTETFVKHVLLVVSIGALFRLRAVRGPLEAIVKQLSDTARESVRRTAG